MVLGYIPVSLGSWSIYLVVSLYQSPAGYCRRSGTPKHEQYGVEVSTFVTLFLLITSSPTFSPQKRIVVWLWGFLLRFMLVFALALLLQVVSSHREI